VEPVLDRLLRLWGSSPRPGNHALDAFRAENYMVTEVWASGDDLRRLMQLEALASLSQPAARPCDLPMGVADVAE
jgi:hypothetical protein